MARAKTEEISDRIDALQGMILEGEPNTLCLIFRDSSGGSQGLRVTAFLNVPGRKIKADVDETGIDRQELLAWSI